MRKETVEDEHGDMVSWSQTVRRLYTRLRCSVECREGTAESFQVGRSHINYGF